MTAVPATARVTLAPSERFQTIDGFGANINPVGHWHDGALRPVVDLLVDDLGARLFRLDPFGDMDWPEEPGVYASAPFREAWGLARYLQHKGAEMYLNVAGAVPAAMCAADGQTLADVDAYADRVTSLVRWAREEEGLRFRYFGVANETDLGPPEGPFADPAVMAHTVEAVAARFAAAGLGDVRLVAVDQAFYDLTYLEPLAESAAARAAVGVAGMHCYGDFPLTPVRDLIAREGLDWRYWLTEFGDLDQTGEHEWEVALACVRRLLRGLAGGVEAATVWDAYDNWHRHDRSWTLYGILRTANHLYTPKRRYFALRQIYRYVPVGSVRIGATCDGRELPLAAFVTPGGHLTVVGINEGAAPVRLELDVAGLPNPGHGLRLIASDRTRNCALLAEPRFSGGAPPLEVPGESVFTITSLDLEPTGVTVARAGDGDARERG